MTSEVSEILQNNEYENLSDFIVAPTLDKEELIALWWWIKWTLFWILVLLLFGVHIFMNLNLRPGYFSCRLAQ
jgi:hypothetical protein